MPIAFTSMRRDGSVTRDLADRYLAGQPASRVTRRDLAAKPLPQLDEAWIGANMSDPATRDALLAARLALSDTLVAELRAADTIDIGLPIYNFGVAEALKAWIDLVARARVTFRYTPEGPKRLLTGKRAAILVASGGTEAGAALDFARPYLRHVLGFLGINNIAVIAADALMADPGRLEGPGTNRRRRPGGVTHRRRDGRSSGAAARPTPPPPGQ